MNHLTTIKPKRGAQDLQAILNSAPQPQSKKDNPLRGKNGKLYRYPTSEERFKILDTIFNHEFSSKLTPHERNSCKMLATHLTGCVAHHDVYQMACERIQISTEQLCQFLGEWENFSDALKNHWLKGAREYAKVRDNEAEAMAELMKRQATLFDKMGEDAVEQLLDFEDSQAVVSVATNLNTYIQPSKTQDNAHLMTPTQISEYLITVSKGACIVWPHKIGKELQQRGFKKSDYVNAYYVELVR